MVQKSPPADWVEPVKTARLILQDGTVIEGYGLGATGAAIGEVCFNTAMTGYQEVLTDPSYCAQIITFTFPHIGNIGVNDEDLETSNMEAGAGIKGCIMRADISNPSNYRSSQHFNDWLKEQGIIAICGIDTRALTAMIRENGMPNAVIAHSADCTFDIDDLKAKAGNWPGLEGMDLAKEVSCSTPYEWDEHLWRWPDGFGTQETVDHHVVVMDFGIKRNILRCLASQSCKITVVPANSSAQSILDLKPDGIFLSNGPGDPAATGEYVVPELKTLIDSGIPIFGICLGHQMLALALGAKTQKMHQGHHGANHPVKDFTTGKVEITSMNHGFAVDGDSLPDHVTQTHISLFDGSNCGIAVEGKPIFSVQYHPEASPGPQDSHYLFARFADTIKTSKGS
ncbi:MAG: glutamine-hydrolyzing carbamoyl-phosphate synthase small subunit [bacterium]|nr:glutamine-hydrolyzing carbamoyl-phosphate synthase small subunit [bacterium]